MGKMKEHPQYNIVSTRICDQLLAEIHNQRDCLSISDYFRAALEEKVIRDQQRAIDEHLSAAEIEEDNEKFQVEMALCEQGHTAHCAARQAWGDGVCECQMQGIVPGNVSRMILEA
ncbi:hypothetical protein KI809_18840 [Geobacter pelophilus]|uniref:Uncharacterized protein n=1 Tax=Geoanaerobacter pelophilus TaxID=60036 RepID=A0AAW4LCT7_9BACT|nr:hypothetical protein [Geoanaerobacter pelophilus]MBT0666370.1 hypothetical protein [Geoanaerobacter pelophilus]